MSRIRADKIVDRLGTGGPRFPEGISQGFSVSGIVTATSFSGDGSNLTGLTLTRTLTIGVRTGSALTTNLTGSSFNVYDRNTNPISISI